VNIRRRKITPDRFVFNISGYFITALIAICCLIPFALVISGSFTAEESIYKDGYRIIPKVISFESYYVIFKAPMVVLSAYSVTIGLVIVGTVSSLFLTCMTAYVLHKKDFKYRNRFSYFFYFTTLFSGGLVPWYILMVKYLGLKNSLLALLLPHLFSVFNIIVMRTFFKSIPEAIGESAKVDGAGEFTVFIRLYLPMSVPALATIGLFIALGYWNDWFAAMLFITNEKMFPLQYFLYKVLNTMAYVGKLSEMTGIPTPEMPKESFKLAMTVIATGPIIFLYPFIQKYFIQGITVGAVKG
jgi:putative aldouronate transport system permease protein